jgi:hypothetical protein
MSTSDTIGVIHDVIIFLRPENFITQLKAFVCSYASLNTFVIIKNSQREEVYWQTPFIFLSSPLRNEFKYRSQKPSLRLVKEHSVSWEVIVH